MPNGNLNELARQSGFDEVTIERARKAGYSDREISEFLQGVQQPLPEAPALPGAPGRERGTIEKAVTAFPESAVRGITNIASAVRHPVQTAEMFGRFGLGAAGKLAKVGVPTGVPTPELIGEREVDVVTNMMSERYGGLSNMKQTIETDPFGFLMDASAILGGLGVTAPGRLGMLANKIGRGVDPLANIGKVVGKTTKAAGWTLGQVLGVTTGAGYGSVRRATRGGLAFKRALRGDISGQDILSVANDSFLLLKDQMARRYKGQFAEVTKFKRSVDISPVKKRLDSLLRENNVSKVGKKLDFTRSKFTTAEAKNIREIWSRLRTYGTREGDRTAAVLDTQKQWLDGFYSDSSQTRAFVASLRKEVSDVLQKQVPGYASMTADYERVNSYVMEMKKALSLDPRAGVDTAIKKLTSVLKEDNDFRRMLVQQLEQVSGRDITGKIAGLALSPAVPRGPLGRVLTGVEFLGGMTLNPKLFGIMLMGSPRLVGELMNVLSKAAKAEQAIKARRILSPLARQTTFQAGRARREVHERPTTEFGETLSPRLPNRLREF